MTRVWAFIAPDARVAVAIFSTEIDAQGFAAANPDLIKLDYYVPNVAFMSFTALEVKQCSNS